MSPPATVLIGTKPLHTAPYVVEIMTNMIRLADATLTTTNAATHPTLPMLEIPTVEDAPHMDADVSPARTVTDAPSFRMYNARHANESVMWLNIATCLQPQSAWNAT